LISVSIETQNEKNNRRGEKSKPKGVQDGPLD